MDVRKVTKEMLADFNNPNSRFHYHAKRVGNALAVIYRLRGNDISPCTMGDLRIGDEWMSITHSAIIASNSWFIASCEASVFGEISATFSRPITEFET